MINYYAIILERRNVFFVLRMVGLIILFSCSFSYLLGLYGIQLVNPIESKGLTEKIIVGVIFAPLFESWAFQYLPFLFFQKWYKKEAKLYTILYISTSTLIFAIQHFYSIWYILAMIVPGIILAYSFIHFYNLYNNLIVPFWFIVIIHALMNLIATISDYLP